MRAKRTIALAYETKLAYECGCSSAYGNPFIKHKIFYRRLSVLELDTRNTQVHGSAMGIDGGLSKICEGRLGRHVWGEIPTQSYENWAAFHVTAHRKFTIEKNLQKQSMTSKLT